MTTMSVEIKFIRIDDDIHAAVAYGYQYNTLCKVLLPHDTPKFRMGLGGNLTDVCEACKEGMEALGLPTEGKGNLFHMITSKPSLFRAVLHLFEAARHVEGYCEQCPVCGGTQVDGDEGCRMCLPLAQLHLDAKAMTNMANAVLLVDDPFEGVR